MCSRVTNPAPDVRRSRAPVLVVSVPPGSGIPGILVSAQGRQVEEAERAHQLLDAAGVGRVRVVDDSALQRERAQPLALPRGPVDVREVVLGAVLLLLLGERRTEVVLEVTAEG